MAIDGLVARREVNLRENLWRMLYETAGRSDEILGVNIEDEEGGPVAPRGWPGVREGRRVPPAG
jgi:hypothetical protein